MINQSIHSDLLNISRQPIQCQSCCHIAFCPLLTEAFKSDNEINQNVAVCHFNMGNSNDVIVIFIVILASCTSDIQLADSFLMIEQL